MMLKNVWKSASWMALGGLTTYGIMNQYSGSMEMEPKQMDQIKTSAELFQLNNSVASKSHPIEMKFKQAIEESRQKLLQWKTIQSIPGYVVGVSIKGKNVWIEGNGFADIENAIPCHKDSVMRIGSISKAIVATLLAKMVQDKQIDLDKSIHEYLDEKYFPRKQWEGKPVDITLRQLAAHRAGIRHYKEVSPDQPEFSKIEYYLKDNFSSITDSLFLFKDDPLVAQPGGKYHYTTFGYTLLSAVMETQMKSKNFPKELKKFIHSELGLSSTYLDESDPIIFNRAKYYYQFENKILNVPYVDNSYKWAGGGLLSNIPDLLKYGNIMLYSFKGKDLDGNTGYLHSELVDEMWRPVLNSYDNNDNDITNGYGIGFMVSRDRKAKNAFTAGPRFSTMVKHTGGAIGCTSLLMIAPESEIIIAILCNLQDAKNITSVGTDVAHIFFQHMNISNHKV